MTTKAAATSNRPSVRSPNRRRVLGGSLRRRIFLVLAPGLIIIATVVTALRYVAAERTAEQLFDRTLLAVAHAVSRDVVLSKGDVVTEALLKSLTSSLGDNVYYHVRGPRGEFVTGFASPPIGPRGLSPPSEAPLFYNGTHYGAPIRAVALREHIADPLIGGWVTVTVWQTTRRREAMSIQLALWSAGQMFGVIGAAGFILWFGVAWALRPLNSLREAVEIRSLDDLSPIKRPAPKEARSLVAAMNSLFRRQAASLAARDALISNAAHQLRNPIASLQAQAEAAASAPDEPTLRLRVDALAAAARRAGRLTKQLLSMELASTRQVQLDDKIDLVAVARRAAEARAPEALGKDIEYSFNIEGAPRPIAGDELMLYEAVENLIDNALKYGAGAPIRVIVAFDKARARVVVENDGPPVPKNLRERIFERFVRDAPEDHRGCGLGLAIVREIALAHGGGAACLNRTSGAAFEISLPR
ncbi:MAG: sensor histidine kinase [Neomegalonema sp.]|nr:sensor histidine kinase [Neomegalonema sp.]